MAAKRFIITTLGCKVNQYEAESVGEMLEEKGFLQGAPHQEVDVHIINTCAVTAKAAMQSRQSVRQALRNSPNAAIVVTGCYAQIAPKEIAAIRGVRSIVGQCDKHRLPQILEDAVSRTAEPQVIWRPSDEGGAIAPFPAAVNGSRSRPILKIQDGCNAFCTYCIVPHTRGRSRSLAPRDVIEQVRRIDAAGFKEVVLSGIHIGMYGLDLSPATSLFELLLRLADMNLNLRIRLSSIEPRELTDDIIDLVAEAPRFCHHFHIPLQSGDDGILKRMHRPYTAAFFREKILSIHHKIPDAGIGIDVMAGFPGEDERAFNNSLALLQSLPLTYLHVFPFSAREGTPASRFDQQGHPQTIKQRCKKLRDIADQKKNAFFQRQVGKTLDVLVEKGRDFSDDCYKGLSSNYARVRLQGEAWIQNTIIPVCISKVINANGLFGKTVPAEFHNKKSPARP